MYMFQPHLWPSSGRDLTKGIFQKLQEPMHKYKIVIRFKMYDLKCILKWEIQIIFFSFLIKPTRCTNFMNLFWHETLHVSDSSSVHHQEFIHCTLSNSICHTGL